jgi:hypothetical protein
MQMCVAYAQLRLFKISSGSSRGSNEIRFKNVEQVFSSIKVSVVRQYTSIAIKFISVDILYICYANSS